MTAILDRNLWTVLRRVMDAPLALRVVLSIALAAASACAGIVAPFFLARFVDALAESQGNFSSATGLAAAFLVAMFASKAVSQVQAFHYAMCDQILQRRISQTTFDLLLSLPMSFHLATSKGTLFQIQAHALQGGRMVLGLACASLMPVAVQIIGVLWIVGAEFSFDIWSVVFATILAYACVFTIGVQRTVGPTGVALQHQVISSGQLSEALTNVEAIKDFTAERRFSRSYSVAVRQTEAAWRISAGRRLETGLAASAVFLISMGASLWLGISGVQGGELSAGDIVLLVTLMTQIIGPLEMSGHAARDVAQGLSYLVSLAGLFQHEAETIADEEPLRRSMSLRKSPAGIAFENVSLSYEAGRPVLSNVEFTVMPGTIVAVVGATGEGKTSLLRLVLKHVRPDTGRVLIDNVAVTDIAPEVLRRRIALVPQDACLFNASLRFNIVLGRPDASDEDILRIMRLVRLEPLVHRLRDGLDTIVGDRGHKLSGGERQRIAIARALLSESDILLLDEATASLDIVTEREIGIDLAGMIGERTILMVTHRLALAAAATEIIVLKNGRVVERGNHEELMMRKQAYHDLWSTNGGASHEGS